VAKFQLPVTGWRGPAPVDEAPAESVTSSSSSPTAPAAEGDR
jgi:NAD+ kinase